MDANWIIVANASRARLFSQESDGAPLTEVADLVHEETRLRTAETQYDQIGQRASSGTRHGSGAPAAPNGYEPHQTPVEHQIEMFGREIAALLAQEQRAHKFTNLVMIASPQFLGVLRKLLDQHVSSAIKISIGKDYTHCSAAELRAHIDEHRVGA